MPIPHPSQTAVTSAKVLIVDGSPVDAERSRMELVRAGVANDFRIVSQAAGLRSELRAFRPDAVVCELVLPGFDGYDALQIVRELTPDTPLIFVSGSSDEDVAARAIQSGAADYVPKAALFRLPGAVRASTREAEDLRRLKPSASGTNVRSRRHHDRLIAIWRIVNDPNLHGRELLAAVLDEALTRMAAGEGAGGFLAHVDGTELVIDAVAGELRCHGGTTPGPVVAGLRVPLDDVIPAREIMSGRTSSWDDIDAVASPPAFLADAALRSQITTQFHADGATHVLTLGSREPRATTAFVAEDYAYVEVVSSIVARQLERERHARSLHDAEEHTRRHSERLDALSRIVTDPNLRGDERLRAMLREGARVMRAGQAFEGTLGHIEGSQFVLDASSVEHPAPAAGEPLRLLRAGMRVDLSDTLNARDLAGARTQSWEDCQSIAGLPERLRLAGLRSLIRTRFDVSGVRYVLTLQSLEPPTATAFSSEDHHYVEVLGSVFARALELEAMETSLRELEAHKQRHAQRLDSLWRIVNTPSLRGDEIVRAVLHEGAAAMRQGRRYIGVLRHVEDAASVIDAVGGELGTADSPARRALAVGTCTDLGDALLSDDAAGRTKSWEDLHAANAPKRADGVAWRSMITTTFAAAGERFELAIGSLEPHQDPPYTSEDNEYIEVLASVLARQIDLETMEHSLGNAEFLVRQHAERLEALWRIANNPALGGTERIPAMLRHGAAAIRPGRHFVGALSRFEDNEIIVIAEGSPERDDPDLTRVGKRVPLEQTLLPLVSRTRSWDDLETLGPDRPPGETRQGWRAFIATTFDAGGTRYALVFGSPEPATPPFNADDAGYLEVLASSFAGRLQVDELEDSLRDAEERSRQHAERLEALWRIINSSNLRDEELILAMLEQAAATILPGQEFEAKLLRIEGSDAVVEAITGSAGNLTVGTSIPLDTLALARVIAEGGGTRSWDDIDASAYASAFTRSRSTRTLVMTSFVAGGATWALAFSSTRTSRRPIGPQDHAYVEVIASFFANHLHRRWQFDRMQYQQSHDVLTGLLNRSTFRSKARTAARTRTGYAIVLVDVDSLHEINESYGHIIGDAVLVEVASALRGVATEDEIVGRIGGDVFGIYIPEPRSPEHLFARVLEFAETFERPFSTGDRDGKEFIARTACLGIAAAPQDGTQFESILSHADAALYTAQERGHGSTVFYIAGMEAEAQRRATLHNELREAIASDQFTLHYQPHIEIATGKITGCEALIRWNHPTRGLLSPVDFIPFAEQTGIITSIDTWVMRNAFAAAARLGALRSGFRLYFNLSGRQAGDPKLVRSFVEAARNGLKLENIGVEITETDAMRDVDSTRHVCRALRRLNVRIAIDDFGTGYSSLSSLKRLPVDIVKIDRAFISGVLSDPHDANITETIIAIAQHFGFETLAEGTEERAELDWLRERACRYAQGYFVRRPAPLDEFTSWVALHDERAWLAQESRA